MTGLAGGSSPSLPGTQNRGRCARTSRGRGTASDAGKWALRSHRMSMHGPPKDSPDLPVQAHHDPRLFPDTAPSRHPDNPPTVPRSVDAHVLWKCLLHGDWWRWGAPSSSSPIDRPLAPSRALPWGPWTLGKYLFLPTPPPPPKRPACAPKPPLWVIHSLWMLHSEGPEDVCLEVDGRDKTHTVYWFETPRWPCWTGSFYLNLYPLCGFSLVQQCTCHVR